MKLGDIVSYAANNLRRHTMRTVLTCAGVAVGVGTLTIMVSLGFGLEETIAGQFDRDEFTTRITVTQAGKNRNPFVVKPEGEQETGEPLTDAVIERLRAYEGVAVVSRDHMRVYVSAETVSRRRRCRAGIWRCLMNTSRPPRP